jgi:A/G-specific adenine glycosylase
MSASFAARVLHWQVAHGRQNLPWQNLREPYRVWLSEIMLQQTQVSTVLAYYPRFLKRFPSVQALAQAPLDDVLALWSGLGYYSRARNLHRCAQTVVSDFGGEFPNTAEQLADLPGIGPSTAAAIAAFCFGERVAILDGNVKRVLARHAGFAQDLSSAKHVNALWDIATDHLPTTRLQEAMPRYTQAMMDLGATLCLARAPRCNDCPVRSDCVAAKTDKPEQYPVKTRKLKRTSQALWLLLAQNGQGQVWLAQRPMQGVWGGLYTPPVFESSEDLLLAWPTKSNATFTELTTIKHVLTHKDLFLHPMLCTAKQAPTGLQGAWYAIDAALAMGLPAPVRTMFEKL